MGDIISAGEARLFNRLRRRLRHGTGEILFLHRCREKSKGFHDLGRYYITDARNCIICKDVDLYRLQSDLNGEGR
jgi:hypothetical protein